MFGQGVMKGLAVTLREFVQTYVDDIKKIPSRYAGGRGEMDQSVKPSEQQGLFTIQYPEEHRKLPERFRYIPMLIYEPETGEDRCTACGICAKVCPPQCIWIVRDRDANGKPITRCAEFTIDATICMNCGLCAEFCPFDAIKMNHDFEIAAYDRMPLIFKIDELRVPTTYYAKLYPTAWMEEEAERAAKAKEKEARQVPAKPAAAPAATSAAPAAVAGTPATAAAAAPAAPATAAAPAAAGGRPSPEELERRRAEARARKAAAEAAAAAGGSGAPDAEAPAAPVAPASAAPAAPAAAAPAASGGRPSPEELERRRAEARARKAAQQAQAAQEGGDGTKPEGE